MTFPLRLSVLDVAPVLSGSTAREALTNSVDLARHVEALGYERYWLAEHHNTSGIASSVPAVLIGHIAAATSTIRVGSGGVMLPNHAPLHVAESFRLLEELHPGRIDLGIGRAPGTDGLTALALRRSREARSADDFPEQLDELVGFLTDDFPADHPFRDVVASPQGPSAPSIYLLGSSGYSGALAARLGMGFAFASHINPVPAAKVLRAYQNEFQPSLAFPEPHAILALSAICADDDATAEDLALSLDLTWLRIGQGRGGPLPSVEEARAHDWSEQDLDQRRINRSRHVIGGPAKVQGQINVRAAEAGVTEVMVLSMIHDHAARRRSYELLTT